ncbi:MAG: hypothetical protein HUU60_04865 [Armatimonadetes bacterium]|nr:hypothetical protein [Armatimonadota bacterium]
MIPRRPSSIDAIIGTGATLYGTASYADSQLAGSLGSLSYKINTGSPFASFGYAYYADGALAEAADTAGSTSRSYEWDYNPDGSLHYETIGSSTTAFEYDDGGNLVYAGSPCVGEYEAAYDAFGRRVWERIDPAGGSAIETHCNYDCVRLARTLALPIGDLYGDLGH